MPAARPSPCRAPTSRAARAYRRMPRGTPALPNRDGRRPPDERVRAEDHQDDRREPCRACESEGEVRQGLDDEPDAHDVAETDPPRDPAVGAGAEKAADRRHRSEQSETDRAEAQPLAGVQDE